MGKGLHYSCHTNRLIDLKYFKAQLVTIKVCVCVWVGVGVGGVTSLRSPSAPG